MRKVPVRENKTDEFDILTSNMHIDNRLEG